MWSDKSALLETIIEDSFQDAGFPPKRVATPRQRGKRKNGDAKSTQMSDDESGSGESAPTLSAKQKEEDSPQSVESSESMIESSQQPRVNKWSKLRKASKSKALKMSKNGVEELEDGGTASEVNEAVKE